MIDFPFDNVVIIVIIKKHHCVLYGLNLIGIELFSYLWFSLHDTLSCSWKEGKYLRLGVYQDQQYGMCKYVCIVVLAERLRPLFVNFKFLISLPHHFS